MHHSDTSLLDWAESRTLSRATDPKTSVDGAKHIATRINQRASEFLKALANLGPSTAKEVAYQVYPDNHARFDSVRRRSSDLVKMGLVRQLEPRTCRLSGKSATVYEVVK